ncbi:hypothetical protein EZS27_000715 [termite gut metagenome]|uniref:PEGA domain-containing protein n=1 Tax=termite gut metagenome TaxID=433724 RepID=A0A5J4T1H3_9ZZZZ
MKRKINFLLSIALVAILLEGCGVANVPLANVSSEQTISIDSEPQGAKVIANGQVMGVTPCKVIVPVPANASKYEFTFLKDGYENGNETIKAQITYMNRVASASYPNHVFHILKKSNSYVVDPTIRAGEATNPVTRDNPGSTALERTIIRWNFDSEPRGSRIFWRVISSIPDQVKNTNELYLTTTPYEETRSFNILGLTYESSRDVTIEIKVTKTGYEDQVKRYNVRQAIDQQEISGFFELVKK